MSTQAEEIRQTLILLWTNRFKDKFLRGKLVYERQFQAELYRLLYGILSPEYEIWVETHAKEELPYMLQHEGSNKARQNELIPDLVITYAKKVVAIIELKWKPWEEPGFHDDIRKLKYFYQQSKVPGKYMQLGTTINSPNAFRALDETQYQYDPGLLICYIVFGHPGRTAWNTIKQEMIFPNFLFLKGKFLSTDDVQFEVAGNEIPIT